jgi:arsenate reductase (thioredoxin)
MDCVLGGLSYLKNVMFVGDRNSCHSQMAEGWLRSLSAGRIFVHSAGWQPTQLNLKAVEVMAEVGIDINGQLVNALSGFRAKNYDGVISLSARKLPDEWMLRQVFEQWRLNSPENDPDGEAIEALRQIRDELKIRVEMLLMRRFPSVLRTISYA